jgi:DNA-binding transcriptional MerR regulator
MTEAMTIGTAARAAGVNLQTVRFYERRRLIPRPSRTAAGYRTFGDDDVRRIRFIKRAQALGFSLREIRDLIAVQCGPQAGCDELRDRAAAKIVEIDAKIRNLTAMRDSLALLARRLPGRRPADLCPIWDCLTPGNEEPPARPASAARGRSRARSTACTGCD